jgi:hypothetical protein
MSELRCNVHIQTRSLEEAIKAGSSYCHRVYCDAKKRKGGNWTSEMHAHTLLKTHACHGVDNPRTP